MNKFIIFSFVFMILSCGKSEPEHKAAQQIDIQIVSYRQFVLKQTKVLSLCNSKEQWDRINRWGMVQHIISNQNFIEEKLNYFNTKYGRDKFILSKNKEVLSIFNRFNYILQKKDKKYWNAKDIKRIPQKLINKIVAK